MTRTGPHLQYLSNLIILNTDNDYSVVHMAHKIDKFAYKFCCGMTIGGVLGMRKDQFIKINGYSNEYYVSSSKFTFWFPLFAND